MRLPYTAGEGALRPRSATTIRNPPMRCTSFRSLRFLRSLFTSVWDGAVALVDHPSDGPPAHEYRKATGAQAKHDFPSPGRRATTSPDP